MSICALLQLLCIIVEEESQVAAFKNYSPSADEMAPGSASSSAVPASSGAASAKDYPQHLEGRQLHALLYWTDCVEHQILYFGTIVMII